MLAIIYSDIMEFHRQAYKFFRRNGEEFTALLLEYVLMNPRLEEFFQVLMGPI